MKVKRISLIEEYINQHKTVSIDELCEHFRVSKNTIRRDIEVLVEGGGIKKIYGGVTVPNEGTPNNFSTYAQRAISCQDDKLDIARQAAEFIEDGDTIFVDSGTTTVGIIDFLGSKNVTVLTYNLDFIIKAIPFPNIRIISLPGEFLRDTLSFVGSNGADFLETFNIKKSFMATTGFSEKRGVTNSSPLESSIKKSAIKNSEEIFLLADMSKYMKTALMTYCELSEVDYIVTKGEIPQSLKEYAQMNDINIKI